MRISDWSSDVCSSDLPSLLERTQIALIPLDDLGRLDIAQERDPPSPQPCEMRRRAPAAAQIIAADRAIALLGQLRPPHHEAAFLLRELVNSANSELWPRKMTPSARLVAISAERSS